MKMRSSQLIILIVVALMVLPVFVSGQDTSNTTIVPTTTETVQESPVTTQTSPAMTTTTIPETTTTTVLPVTTTTLTLNITETTPATTTTVMPASQAAVGNVTVASSPLGAAILIDGVYYGTTPGSLTGIPAGNHLIRLTLSGYTDYEGTTYVVAGQSTPVYGTLHPMSGYYNQPVTILVTPSPTPQATPATTVQPVTTQAKSEGVLESPTVIAAIIGIFTAIIGAGATLLTHKSPAIKDEKEPKP